MSKFYPPIIHNRIISQSSLFLVCNSPYLDMRERKDQKLHELQIPFINVLDIRNELSKLGINGKSIWPDIEGVIKYVQWYMLEKYS